MESNPKFGKLGRAIEIDHVKTEKYEDDKLVHKKTSTRFALSLTMAISLFLLVAISTIIFVSPQAQAIGLDLYEWAKHTAEKWALRESLN